MAAKDGKSAGVIARGDLDGDGKTSELTLHVHLDGDRLVLDPKIAEREPEE